MCENPQYDNLIGGDQEVPSTVRLMHFAAARCKEIQALQQSLRSTKGGKLAFQKLPIHMRRRVMSHNAKRLPRRLRETHMNQLKKSGLGGKHKRPSRKYRRRPKNLLCEYTRRQKKCKWLETHIWHAKRFHMTERWGFKLPQSPCDKAFRACYRASAKHCLLEDISYIGCIEINAQENRIIECFSKICDRNVNMSVSAKCFINGLRQGELTLFSNGVPLGVVNFHWMPKISDESCRKIWIWVHAACFDLVLKTLINLFDVKLENDGNCYKNQKDNVSLWDLRFDLNRFRLTGPLSHAVLQKCLLPVDFSKVSDDWTRNYLNDNNSDIFFKQGEYWRSIKAISSPSELSPHIIIGLIASDPRYNLPKKRLKALIDNTEIPSAKTLESIPDKLSFSPIWEKTIRTSVKEQKISNFDLCKARRKLLVPGTDMCATGMPVPYLIIQRPGNRDNNIGFCSGWDLILPSGWGQPTWLSLIMWGARAGGLREAESNRFEMGFPSILEPDTESGQKEDDRLSELYRNRYFSLPPNKRVNYNKFSIVNPFEFKWKILLKDWNCFPLGAKHFYVLRDKKLLRAIQENLTKKIKIDINNVNYQVPYIVPVRLVLDKRGTAKRYSVIYLPKQDDVKRSVSITEPLKTDENQSERNRLRKAHKILLKKLKRCRKNYRLSGKKFIPKVNYVEEYKKKMSELWLPNVENNIRRCASRETIGWVTKGDFCFSVGKTVAIGYVVMGSFPALFSSTTRSKVLIRNANSRQYRVATLEIIV